MEFALVVEESLIHRALAFFLFAAVQCTAVFAAEILADGEAVIENDDITLARQIALRRAMTSAIEQAGGMFQATTVLTPLGVQERTSLSSRHRVLSARIAAERIEKGKLMLVAEVRLDTQGSAQACDGMPRRTVAVAAFPLQYPEQLRAGEFTGWPQATADELAAQFNRNGKLLGISAGARMPFVSAEEAPTPAHKEGGGLPLLVEWARTARAQYVVSGVFRDFGQASRAWVLPERQMTVELFIHDGISGDLLARQTFRRGLARVTDLPADILFGSREFRTSMLGQVYLSLLQDMRAWTESIVSCLPFSARVLQASGQRMQLDVGSDSGIEAGMEFLLTRGNGSGDGDSLGHERRLLAGVVVKSVHARHSVAEITARKNSPTARVGDVLFGH